MPAAPAPGCRSSSNVAPFLAAAAVGGWILLVGGRWRVHLLEPDLAILHLTILTAAAAAGLWLALRDGRLTRCGAVALLLPVGSATSAVTAVWPRGAWEATFGALTLAGLTVLSARLAADRDRRVALLDALLLGAAAVALVALCQQAGVLTVEAEHFTEDGRLRAAGSLNHPNNLAGFLALMLPVAIGTCGRRRWLGAVSTALLAGALAGTYSKGGQLAALVGVAVTVAALPVGGWLGWLRAEPVRARRGVVALAAGLSAGLVAVWCSPLGGRLRLFVELLPTLRQFRRWDTYRAALGMVESAPLAGVGPGGFAVALPEHRPLGAHPELFAHAHSWYLQAAAEQGIVGLVLLLLVLGVAAATLRADLRGLPAGAERRRVAGLLGGLAGFAGAGLLDVNVGVPAIGAAFAWWLGLAVGPCDRPSRATGLLPPALLGLVLLTPAVVLWNRANAVYLRACGQIQQGNLLAAAELVERARAWDPGQRAYDLARVDLALWTGQGRAAHDELRRLLTDGPPLDTWYRLALARLEADDRERDILLRAAQQADRAEPQVLVETALIDATGFGSADHAVARFPEAAGAYVAKAAELVGEAEARRELDRGATCADPRDRAPRFFARWGRLDPALALDPPRRGRLLAQRTQYDGPVLPRARLRLLEARLAASANPATAPPGR